MAKFSGTKRRPLRTNLTAPIATVPERMPTNEGGEAFARDPESELFLLAVTNMVGEDTFYESAADRDARFAQLVDQVTRTNPAFIAGEVALDPDGDVDPAKVGLAQYLRTSLGMRSASVVMAAEYVAKEGNERVILCERGIKTFERSTRYTLDLSAVPVLKRETHLPIVVDPSHAAGRSELVLPLARAAVAAGADGVMVEVHPQPEDALCDGPQQVRVGEFARFADEIRTVVALMGKTVG